MEIIDKLRAFTQTMQIKYNVYSVDINFNLNDVKIYLNGFYVKACKTFSYDEIEKHIDELILEYIKEYEHSLINYAIGGDECD